MCMCMFISSACGCIDILELSDSSQKRKRFIHEGRRVLHIYSTDNSAPMERERKREDKERGYEKESERSLLTINT